MNKEEKELINLTKKKIKIKREKVNIKWVIEVIVITFILSFLLSFLSQKAIPNISVFWGIIITLLIVFINILFDIIGVSVTASDEKVFHSMAARKVKAAKQAVTFKKNADKVSSFCCDVIGDICGIISGACGTNITLIMVKTFNFNLLFTGLVVAAIIASLTIGGKALGKSFAINNSNIILYEFARVISIFHKN